MLVQRMSFDEEKKTVLEEKDIPDTGKQYARMHEQLDKEKRKKTQRKHTDFIEEAIAHSINATTSRFRSKTSLPKMPSPKRDPSSKVCSLRL